MLPDSSLYNIADELESIGVLLHHVVAESYAVARVCRERASPSDALAPRNVLNNTHLL